MQYTWIIYTNGDAVRCGYSNHSGALGTAEAIAQIVADDAAPAGLRSTLGRSQTPQKLRDTVAARGGNAIIGMDDKNCPGCSARVAPDGPISIGGVRAAKLKTESGFCDLSI